jgi:hypothetical protein
MNVTIRLVVLRLRMSGAFLLHVFVERRLIGTVLYFNPFSAEKALEVSRL